MARMRLHCKLVPGHNREYEYGLVVEKLVLRFLANHNQCACFFVQSEAKPKTVTTCLARVFSTRLAPAGYCCFQSWLVNFLICFPCDWSDVITLNLVFDGHKEPSFGKEPSTQKNILTKGFYFFSRFIPVFFGNKGIQRNWIQEF